MNRTQMKVGIGILLFLLAGCAGKDRKLSDQGFVAIVKEDYERAEKYLEQAIALNPNNPQALLDMGLVFENTGRPQHALVMYQRVLLLGLKGKEDQNNVIEAEGETLSEIARMNIERLSRTYTQEAGPIEGPSTAEPAPVVQKEPLEPEVAGSEKPSPPTEEPVSPPLSPIERVEDKPAAAPPKPQQPVPTKGFYSIQIGAFQNPTIADLHVKRLKEQGYEAFSLRESIRGKGNLYRVHINRYDSKAKALAEAQTLIYNKVITDYVIRFLKD